MTKNIFRMAFALLAAMYATGELNAQSIRSEYGSVRLNLGLHAPVSTFTDDTYGESSFANGMAIGASVLVWPMQGRLGLGAQLMRSSTDGLNDIEYAPMALNDPVQWFFTGDIALRHIFDNFSGFPYISAGVGLKQYNWAVSVHSEDRFFLWNLAAGLELRPSVLGPFGFMAEVRSYHSKLIAFGIDDGTWKPGTPANPLYTDIGFYGGVVGGQSSHDLVLTTGFSLVF